MNKIAYVSGNVSGHPKEIIKNKFNVFAKKLINMGYQVVSPLGVYESELQNSDASKADIKKLMECDEVHMLPDWQESRGAQLHRDIAVRLGMRVVYH